MKVQPRDIKNFLSNPPTHIGVILVYGPDHGLMKERAEILGKKIVEDLNDPFNAVTLTTAQIIEEPSKLADEANAMSLMGGKRLLRIKEASDKLTPYLKSYLEHINNETLIILEAGELTPRNALRKLCEAENNAAALPCYNDEARDKSTVIREMLSDNQIRIDNDALSWLSSSIHGDRAQLRSEIEKLTLYAWQNKHITLLDAQTMCADAGEAAIDQCIEKTLSGQTIDALKLYNTINEEGINFMIILRALQNYIKRLHQVKSKVENGQNIENAMKTLQPPVFFKQAASFKNHAKRWSALHLMTAMQKLQKLEADCKKTGSNPELLCGQTILGLSKMAS